MMKTFARILLLFIVLLSAPLSNAQEIRFPPPDFDTTYVLPDLYTPAPPGAFGWWDSVILFGALSLTTWLVHIGRSRRGLFLMSIFALAFFGFYRKGCICPVGSTQNVLAAAIIPDVGVSWIVLSFFVLPLLFSLFFGRVFCSAVCPLGAIQELVAVAPIRIPSSVDRALGMGKYIYLGLAVVGISTGTGFLVCRFDPFVGIYRLGHSFNMLLAGGVMLLLGVFIARPYCRFLCPYGVLLGWMSYFSKWHLDIAPQGKCVDCRLCEDSCPYNAMDMPVPENMLDDPVVGKRRTRGLVMLAPAVILACALGGFWMSETLARMHMTVQLSERVALEDSGVYENEILWSETFRAADQTTAELHADALVIRGKYKKASTWLGAFIGLIISLKLIGASVAQKRDTFEAHKETCFSCGRCYPYCPVEPMEPVGTAV